MTCTKHYVVLIIGSRNGCAVSKCFCPPLLLISDFQLFYFKTIKQSILSDYIRYLLSNFLLNVLDYDIWYFYQISKQFVFEAMEQFFHCTTILSYLKKKKNIELYFIILNNLIHWTLVLKIIVWCNITEYNVILLFILW